jgi:uncharacterized protein
MGPGNFVWNELLTRDVEAAKRFYVGVLGWTFRPHTTMGGTYWIAEKDGKAVAGLMAMPEMAPPGVPAHWLAYVKVEDVDASVRRAVEEGGRALRPNFDVPDVGRLGIIADSTGAALGLLTPRRRG